MSWKDIKQPSYPRLSAPRPGPALACHPPFSAAIIQATTALFSEPIKGEVNEAWGGNYTNANRQMSHIVPHYNKQYGRPWYICIRKGSIPRKPCCGCILQEGLLLLPHPPLWHPCFCGVKPVAFLCDTVLSLPDQGLF